MQETLQRIRRHIAIANVVTTWQEVRGYIAIDTEAQRLVSKESRAKTIAVANELVREYQRFGDVTARRLPTVLFVALDGRSFVREGVIAGEKADETVKAVFFTLSEEHVDLSFYYQSDNVSEPREVSFAEYAENSGETGQLYQDFYDRPLSAFGIDHQASIALAEASPMPLRAILQFPSAQQGGSPFMNP